MYAAIRNNLILKEIIVNSKIFVPALANYTLREGSSMALFNRYCTLTIGTESRIKQNSSGFFTPYAYKERLFNIIVRKWIKNIRKCKNDL